MQAADIPRLNTIGAIAETLDVPVHRVQHVLATRRHIKASALAGNARLFSAEAVSQIKQALTEINQRRSRRTALVNC